MHSKTDIFLDNHDNATMKITDQGPILGYELHISNIGGGAITAYGTAEEMAALEFYSFEYHDCLKVGTVSVFDSRVNGEDSRLVELANQLKGLA